MKKTILVLLVIAAALPLSASAYFENRGQYYGMPLTVEVVHGEAYSMYPEPTSTDIDEIFLYLDEGYVFLYGAFMKNDGTLIKSYTARAGSEKNSLKAKLKNLLYSFIIEATILNSATGEEMEISWLLEVSSETEEGESFSIINPEDELIVTRVE